ncbi:MAG TPA: metal ABC transporter permease [Candidatus Aminicenantes bacterium]|nr:metal ABC transporter permease [Candidatus Aminicenantes bacterium]
MSDILFSAFLLSVVLLGINSYFGLEIIRRGIIFTDLAIGQTAALGAAVSLFFFDGRLMYPISLLFALLAGLLISLVARRSNNLEAFIGLMYAFGFAAVYIILSKSYHGMEEFQKLMAADILFTPMKDITHTALLYAALGAFIWFVQRRTTGTLRDILFFVTFAVTVTSAVRLAGVLVLFSLLVGPALIATVIGRGIPLVNAWVIGTLVNVGAIALSYRFDFPTGYTIVFCNALLALLAVMLRRGGNSSPHH